MCIRDRVGPNRFEADKLIPVTEAERREVFLQAIGNDHPLMNLILRCINNNPKGRAHASEIVRQLAEMKSQFPASFVNQLEMLKSIKAVEEEKRSLREVGEFQEREIQHLNATISRMSKQFTKAREYLVNKQVSLPTINFVHKIKLNVYCFSCLYK